MNDKWTKRWSVKWIDDTQKTVKELVFLTLYIYRNC